MTTVTICGLLLSHAARVDTSFWKCCQLCGFETELHRLSPFGLEQVGLFVVDFVHEFVSASSHTFILTAIEFVMKFVFRCNDIGEVHNSVEEILLLLGIDQRIANHSQVVYTEILVTEIEIGCLPR